MNFHGPTFKDLCKFMTTVPFRPTVQSRVTICPELNTSGVSSRVTGYHEQLPKQVNRKYLLDGNMVTITETSQKLLIIEQISFDFLQR
jgi:hypothetical protein